MSNKLLKQLINQLVMEAPRWKREGEDLAHPYFSTIQKYVGTPNIYFTMTDINRLGIYPRSSEYSGPLGIYCYPLIDLTFKQLIENTLPYASERRFIQLFSAKEPLKTLALAPVDNSWGTIPTEDEVIYEIIPKLDGHKINYKEENYEDSPKNKIDTLKMNDLERQYLRQKTIHRGEDSPGWFLYRALKEYKRDKSVRWAAMLMKAGFNGVLDMGSGRIHVNEKTQAMFFSGAFLNSLEIVPNYHSPSNQSSKFTALSPYTDTQDEEYRSTYDVNKIKSYNQIKPTKLKFELFLKSFLKKNEISAEEFWGSSVMILQALDSLDHGDRGDDSKIMLIHQIPYDVFLKVVSSLKYEQAQSVEAALITRLKKEDLSYFPAGKLSDYNGHLIEKKFGKDVKGLAEFIEKNNMIGLIERMSLQVAQALAHSPSVPIRRAVAAKLSEFVGYREMFMADESPEVRAVLIQYLSPEEKLTIASQMTDIYKLNDILHLLPPQGALLPNVNPRQAGIIYNQSLSNKFFRTNQQAVDMFFKIYDAKNKDYRFIEQALVNMGNSDAAHEIYKKIDKHTKINLIKSTKDANLFGILAQGLTPEEVFELLHSSYYFTNYPEGALRNLEPNQLSIFLNSPEPGVRVALIREYPEFADRLAEDPDRNVREAVARDSLNREILKKLKNDTDHYVRYAAENSLRVLDQGVSSDEG
jgi:hypothetical protein